MSRKDVNIEELFRSEFKDFKPEPSPGLWRKVRRSFLRRHFFLFRPGSMNIYYLSAIILSAATLVFTLPDKTNNESAVSENEELFQGNYSKDNSSGEDKNEQKITTDDQDIHPKKNKTNEKTASIVVPKSNKNVNISTDTLNKDNVHESTSIETREPKTEEFSPPPPLPLAFFSASITEGCAPLSVSFHNHSENSVSWQWSFGDGGNSETKNPEYIYDEPGEYIVNLTTSNEKGHFSSYSSMIKVYPKPRVRFEMDKHISPGSGQPVYFYNYSKNAESYYWNFGDGTSSEQKDPAHIFDDPGNYDISLTVISENGCKDSMVIKDAFKEKEPMIVFPNAFAPNRSGPTGGYYNGKDISNEVFHPYLKETPEEYTLRIYNKQGILIFESFEAGIGWDGYYREELQPRGVYVWKVRAKFSDGTIIVRMGDVTLL